MRRLIVVLALLCVGACEGQQCDFLAWRQVNITGTLDAERLDGAGTLVSPDRYSDFAFEAKLTWDRKNTPQASFGFCFGTSDAGSPPYYQFILNARTGKPVLCLSWYENPATGQVIAERVLPVPLQKIRGAKLTIQKQGTTVTLCIGKKFQMAARIPKDVEGKIKIMMIEGAIRLEKACL